MKKPFLTQIGAAITVALLLLVAAPAVVAQEEGQPDDKVTLTGQLSTDEMGDYVLIEEESGDSIALYSETDLAEYVGVTVRIVGEWTEDIDGFRFFEVHEIQQSA